MNSSHSGISERRRSILLDNLKKSNATSYITLISIVQGAALGFLLVVLDRITDAGKHLPLISGTQSLLCITSFFLIVIVWNEYLMGITIFEWIPTLIDALIPFSLGLAEFVVTLSIERGVRWGYTSMGFLYFISWLAFLNQVTRTKSDVANDFVLAETRRFRMMSIWGTGLGAIVFTLVAAFAPGSFHHYPLSLVGAVGLLLTMMLQAARQILFWKRVIGAAQPKS